MDKNAGASGHGYGAKAKKPAHNAGGGINKSNEMRSDSTKTVSHKHPYPNGLS